MPKIEKIIIKMRNQPNGITSSEAIKVLEYLDYKLDRQKGSHIAFVQAGKKNFILPKKTTINKTYIKQILEIMEERNEK